MDHDLTLMIYGALMGVLGSIVTSIVTVSFQYRLARREYERRREEQIRQIHLPTSEEIVIIGSQGRDSGQAPGSRKAVRTGSEIISVAVGGVLVHQSGSPLLDFAFACGLGILFTRYMFRSLRG